jgi:hypothetical protein
MNTTSKANTSSESRPSTGWYEGLVAPLLALLFAIAGQWLFTRDNPDFLAGAVSYGFSLILFLSTLTSWPPAALTPPSQSPFFRHLRPITKNITSRLIFILGMLILSVIAFFGFAGNSLMGGIGAWLGAVLFFLIAFAEMPDFEQESLKGNLHTWWQKIDKRALVILLGIILIALFFRVYRLQEVPAEMTSDHAEKLLDVQDILDGKRPIFFPRNTGREAIQFYLTAFLVRFTPLQLNHLALKVGTALIGIFTIPFVFLVGKQFFGTLSGLIAAFLMAISHWHVAITRVGLRFPFTAAFATPALYFLFQAFKSNRRNDWLAAALFLGIGLHTYTAMRIVPLLFVILIGLRLAMDSWLILCKRSLPSFNSWNHEFLINALLGGFFTALLFLPLSRVIIDDPEAFWLRMASRAQSTEPSAVADQILVFINNIKNALLMFNVKGDDVVVNTIPGSPVLGPVTAALFILGIFYLLWRLILHADRRALYVLTTVFVLLLPSILSLAFPKENPSVVRTGGAIPWVMLSAALPLAIALMRFNELPSSSGKWVAGLVVIILAFATIFYNYNWYFVRYDAIIRRSLWNSTEMGMVVRDFVETGGEMADVYHIPYPHWVDTRNIGINAGHIRWANAMNDEVWFGDHSRSTRPRLFLLFIDDITSLRRLMFLFPQGQMEVYDSPREGKDFIIYRVP